MVSVPRCPYKTDRNMHAVLWVLLCVCAGRVHRPTKTRSYFAYWIYSAYSDMLINHSLGWTVSLCNHLQAQWPSTSLLCDSSILHIGMPSSCPSRSNWDDTLCHETRTPWLSQSILQQICNQWWWMLVVVHKQLGPEMWNQLEEIVVLNLESPAQDFFHHEYAKYAKYACNYICRICNEYTEYVEYAEYMYIYLIFGWIW